MTSRLILSAAALLAAAALHADSGPKREVDVVVDLTAAGKAVRAADPDHPAYYYPVVGGYKAMGALVAGEKPPSPKDVVHTVAIELARSGYFVVNKAHPSPSIILAVHWGYMNPEIDNMDPTDPTTQTFFNQNQMLALVGGNTLRNLDLDFEKETVIQAAEDDRYFVVLTAYDAGEYARRHKKVMLWQAKMSVPSNGVNFVQVLPALVKSGEPFFGRETTRPKMLLAPLLPDGRVEVGTPTVKDYLDAPTPPPAPSRATSTPASK